MNGKDQEISTKIIVSKLNQIIELLCSAKKEKDVQDLISINLNCKKRKILSSEKYPDIEVDLFSSDFAIEIKYNANYYSGISQLLAYKYLYNLRKVYIIHMHEYLNKKFINAFNLLSKRLNFIGILINKKKKKILVFNHDKD